MIDQESWDPWAKAFEDWEDDQPSRQFRSAWDLAAFIVLAILAGGFLATAFIYVKGY